MGYLSIDNLYRNKKIMLFKQVYALEKIHGTSAHISFSATEGVKYMSGGSSYENFKSLFDHDKLTEAFKALGHPEVVVFGEAYGGKVQKMSQTYGPKLKFVAFDVKMGSHWLEVPVASDIVTNLGLEFVFFELIDATEEAVNVARDRFSEQAKRNLGPTTEKIAEGVVLRPPIELSLKNGERLIAKHKRAEFSERASGQDTSLDPVKAAEAATAEAVAFEWVTPMRLEHVLDKLFQGAKLEIEKTGLVGDAMVEDVYREGAGEVEDSVANRKAIKKLAAKLFKEKVFKQ